LHKQRIVIISPAYPYRGGQALVEAHLFQYLTQAGYDCHTITFTLLYPSIFFPGTTQSETSGMIFFEHSSRIKRVINSINPFTWIKAAWIINKIKPHAMVLIWWMPFFGPAYSSIALLSKKFTRSRIVFLVENFISHENRWFDRFFTRFTLRLADHFICFSKYIGQQLEQYFDDKSIHRMTLPIYDCYNLNRFNKESSRKILGINTSNVVLFFGFVRPYKGLDILIQAFPLVLSKYPDTTLLIVGEYYEDEQKYIDLVKDHGIENRSIMISKYIPNEELECYFKAADLSCLPYKSGTQSGIAMISYGFHVPVVVTDVGGIAELVVPDKTGVIAPPNQPEKIADGIIRVLELRNSTDFEKNIVDYIADVGYKNLKRIFNQITGEVADRICI